MSTVERRLTIEQKFTVELSLQRILHNKYILFNKFLEIMSATVNYNSIRHVCFFNNII